MTQAELETPHDPAEIYDAQTPDDAAELVNRPLFTGDVLAGEPGESALTSAFGRRVQRDAGHRGTVRKHLRRLLAGATSLAEETKT